MTILLPALSIATFRLIGVLGLLLLAVGLMLACGSASPATDAPADSSEQNARVSDQNPGERDRAALTAFYHATDGPNWADNTNWLTDAPLSEWYGVWVDPDTSGVQRLSLSANRLKGEIPSGFGDLADLLSVDLSRNLLSGCVPLTLVYRQRLVVALAGNLEYGDPRAPMFKGWKWGDLKGCKSPDWEVLVNFYHATGGPDWVESENWLTDALIDNWHGVEVREGRVRSLNLSNNGLSGEIPAELADLDELVNLRLGGVNWLRLSMGTSVRVVTAEVTEESVTNQLRGAIPPELGRLVNLRELDLAGNQLAGSIPPELGNLANLQYLALSENQLTGSIPPELGNLDNLTNLHLSGNRLTGAISPELGNLANLQYLALSGNQLTGSIPPELGNLGNLATLVISANQLTGSIPPELGNLVNMGYLELFRNQLTGEIPTELGNLGKLSVLSLADNQLTGEIPPELVYTNIWRLSLWGNQFSGCVSPHLKQIEEFNIAELGLEWCQ